MTMEPSTRVLLLYRNYHDDFDTYYITVTVHSLVQKDFFKHRKIHSKIHAHQCGSIQNNKTCSKNNDEKTQRSAPES